VDAVNEAVTCVRAENVGQGLSPMTRLAGPNGLARGYYEVF